MVALTPINFEVFSSFYDAFSPFHFVT